MAKGLPKLSYPVFSWYDGYIHLATKPLELCTHPRSLYAETVERARAGRDQILDADGYRFDVVDWIRIPMFGGVSGILLKMTGTVFAAPALTNQTKLPLEEFKKIIANAITNRYRYDSDKYRAIESIQKIQAANSYKTALNAVPWP